MLPRWKHVPFSQCGARGWLRHDKAGLVQTSELTERRRQCRQWLHQATCLRMHVVCTSTTPRMVHRLRVKERILRFFCGEKKAFNSCCGVFAVDFASFCYSVCVCASLPALLFLTPLLSFALAVVVASLGWVVLLLVYCSCTFLHSRDDDDCLSW